MKFVPFYTRRKMSIIRLEITDCLLYVDCLPNAVGKQPSIPLIYLGRKWTLN